MVTNCTAVRDAMRLVRTAGTHVSQLTVFCCLVVGLFRRDIDLCAMVKSHFKVAEVGESCETLSR